jgi:hypothetical protein
MKMPDPKQPVDFSSSQEALQKLIDEHDEAKRQKSEAENMAMMSMLGGNIMQNFARPATTAAEIMAKAPVRDSSEGVAQRFSQPFQYAAKARGEDLEDVLGRYKLASQSVTEQQKAQNQQAWDIKRDERRESFEKQQADDKFKKEKEILGIKNQHDTQNLAAKRAEDNKPKQIAPAQIELFGQGRNAVSALNGLEQKLSDKSKLLGPISGRLNALNPYDTESQDVQSSVESARQIVGKYMEGGVLRAEDVKKYERILPTMKDTPEVARTKVQNVKALVMKKQQDDVNALSLQGYDTAGLLGSQTQPAQPAAAQKQVSSAQAAGKVKVSNGAKTLLIDSTDLEHALADGFKQVQ